MTRANDLTIYERHAEEWWEPRSATFRSLQSVNVLRAELLHEWLGADLTGRVAFDLGCGGGLLAAPLVRAGARVVGVDMSPGSLRVAGEHVAGLFVQGDASRAPLRSATADVVLLADVLEHLEAIEPALDEATRLLRPGGALFVSTINKTKRAKRLAVDLAEGLRLVPRGTHDPELFVALETLCAATALRGLRRERLQGESVAVLPTLLQWKVVLRRDDDVSVGYSALFRKAVGS